MIMRIEPSEDIFRSIAAAMDNDVHADAELGKANTPVAPNCPCSLRSACLYAKTV
jgi:hypothetical protein